MALAGERDAERRLDDPRWQVAERGGDAVLRRFPADVLAVAVHGPLAHGDDGIDAGLLADHGHGYAHSHGVGGDDHGHTHGHDHGHGHTHSHPLVGVAPG